MKTKFRNTFLIVLLIGIIGFVAYTFFLNKGVKQKKIATIQSYIPNVCWVYHEFVYRVDFANESIPSFLFIRNEDGTFSPSQEDKPGNLITGSGFIIDSSGAAVISNTMASPWDLSDEVLKPLRDLVDEWLNMKPENQGQIYNEYHGQHYTIQGQTVVLFIAINRIDEFIEYNTGPDIPGQNNYTVIYPVEKTKLTGVYSGITYSDFEIGKETDVQILNAEISESDFTIPKVTIQIDSIRATGASDGALYNISVIKGDDFFNEGSPVFDKNAQFLGHLHFEKNTWYLISYKSVVQDPPVYEDYFATKQWVFELANMAWRKM